MEPNSGQSAPQPQRRGLLKSLPPLPQPPSSPGITFSRFSLMLGAAVVAAALGWAFFMGFMVGRGENPKEQVAEATSFLRDNGQKTEDMQTGAPDATAAPNATTVATDASPDMGAGMPQPPTATGAVTSGATTADANGAIPATPGPVTFDPHAKPQGESLAAWGGKPGSTKAETAAAAPQPKQQAAKKPQPAQAKPAPAATGPKFLFSYQMGAFKNKAAAEALQKKLAAKGQRASVSQNGKVWLVTYQVRGTEDQARATRLKLEQQGFGKAMLTSRKAVK